MLKKEEIIKMNKNEQKAKKAILEFLKMNPNKYYTDKEIIEAIGAENWECDTSRAISNIKYYPFNSIQGVEKTMQKELHGTPYCGTEYYTGYQPFNAFRSYWRIPVIFTIIYLLIYFLLRAH